MNYSKTAEEEQDRHYMPWVSGTFMSSQHPNRRSVEVQQQQSRDTRRRRSSRRGQRKDICDKDFYFSESTHNLGKCYCKMKLTSKLWPAF